MKKTFTVGSQEYTVCECTAIARDLGESERRKALYVWSISESGEKDEFVLFDYELPEDEYQFFEMCQESPDWDGWYETVESVEIIEEFPDKFLDIETGEIITAGELYSEYTENYSEEERREISFEQYKNNCQTYNGGTLERI